MHCPHFVFLGPERDPAEPRHCILPPNPSLLGLKDLQEPSQLLSLAQMAMMLRSVDLFWPKNIGQVIVVLDKGEEHVNVMLPDYIKVRGGRPRSGCPLRP
jgi:hypothetical protein